MPETPPVPPVPQRLASNISRWQREHVQDKHGHCRMCDTLEWPCDMRVLLDAFTGLRDHQMSRETDVFQQLHEHAKHGLDAINAWYETYPNRPLSTSIGWLIRQRVLVLRTEPTDD